MHFPKIVDTLHYHLWTDALHALALARQAHNKWDRGTYVRWTVTTVWTALEIACETALDSSGIGRRFKENLDAAVEDRGLPKLDWGSGIWQRVSQTHDRRKTYVHLNIPQEQLFAEVADAENALHTIRSAIEAIYVHAGKPAPIWLADDFDRGWDDGRDRFAQLTLRHAGANEDDRDVVKIAYVYKGREYITELLPPGSDLIAPIEELLRNVHAPISEVRAYQGNELAYSRQLAMRGS